MPIDPNRMMSEHPSMTDLLLWLDSCVGENRDSNGGLCPAVLSATKKNFKDKQHSVIERNLKGFIIIVPVSLVHQRSNTT